MTASQTWPETRAYTHPFALWTVHLYAILPYACVCFVLAARCFSIADLSHLFSVFTDLLESALVCGMALRQTIVFSYLNTCLCVCAYMQFNIYVYFTFLCVRDYV